MRKAHNHCMVQVPSTTLPLTEHQQQELTSLVESNSDDFGIGTYLACMDTLHRMLHT